jgi:Tol biopolymer transport system component
VYRTLDFDADPAVDVYIVDADGSDQRPLVRDQTAFTAMWSGDGRVAAWLTDDDALFIMNADGTNRQRVPDGRFPRDWSSDGEWFATVHYERGVGVDVAKHRVDGSDYQVLTAEGFSQINSIEWSPDGGKLVFSTIGRNSDVYTVGADGQSLTNLTEDVFTDFDEHWSADGQSIYFVSYREPYGIYVMDADGHNVRWLDTDVGIGHLLATSPDGKYLLIVGNDLHVLDTDGHHVSQVTDDEKLPRQGDWYIPRSILSVSPFGKHTTSWGWLKASSLSAR